MGQFEWVSTRVPRRVVAVRMRTVDDLHLPTLEVPFGVLAIAFDPDQRREAVERLTEALANAGAAPGIESGGPGTDLWQEGIMPEVAWLRSPKEVIDHYFFANGAGVEVTDFVVLCLDGDDTDWWEV